MSKKHKCRTLPTLREVQLGIGPPVQCPKCREPQPDRTGTVYIGKDRKIEKVVFDDKENER